MPPTKRNREETATKLTKKQKEDLAKAQEFGAAETAKRAAKLAAAAALEQQPATVAAVATVTSAQRGRPKKSPATSTPASTKKSTPRKSSSKPLTTPPRGTGTGSRSVVASKSRKSSTSPTVPPNSRDLMRRQAAAASKYYGEDEDEDEFNEVIVKNEEDDDDEMQVDEEEEEDDDEDEEEEEEQVPVRSVKRQKTSTTTPTSSATKTSRSATKSSSRRSRGNTPAATTAAASLAAAATTTPSSANRDAVERDKRTAKLFYETEMAKKAARTMASGTTSIATGTPAARSVASTTPSSAAAAADAAAAALAAQQQRDQRRAQKWHQEEMAKQQAKAAAAAASAAASSSANAQYQYQQQFGQQHYAAHQPSSQLRNRKSSSSSGPASNLHSSTTPPRSTGMASRPVHDKPPFGSPVPVNQGPLATTTSHFPIDMASSSSSLLQRPGNVNSNMSNNMAPPAIDNSAAVVDNVWSDSEIDTSDNGRRRNAWFVAIAGFVVVVILGALVAAGSYSDVLDRVAKLGNVSTGLGSKHHLHTHEPCFLDFPIVHRVVQDDNEGYESDEILPPHCQESHEQRPPCPKRGICANGRLTGCSHDFFEPSTSGTTSATGGWNTVCKWTTLANEQVASLVKQLNIVTAECMCLQNLPEENPFVRNDVSMEGGRPLFSYRRLADKYKLKYDVDMLRSYHEDHEYEVFLIEDDGSLLGLHPAHAIKLDEYCKVSLWFKDQCRNLLGLLATIAGLLWSGLFYSLKEYPWHTLGVTAASCFVFAAVYRSYEINRNKRRDERDFYNLRDRVFQEISDSPQPVQPAVIRDRIINRLYLGPNESRRIREVTFPKVEDYVNTNASVRTLIRSEHGVAVAYWEWADVKPFAAGPRDRPQTVQFTQ